MRQVTKEGVDLIKHHEKCVRHTYFCPANRLTIGYGHLCLEGDFYLQGYSVEEASKNPDKFSITYLEVEDLLKKDLGKAESAVERLIKVKLTDNQFNALVSFTFNLGSGALGKSTLRRKLNLKDYEGASKEFPRWVYANKKKLDGLVIRREEERELFCS